jgi:long-chain fatty acid transport protein
MNYFARFLGFLCLISFLMTGTLFAAGYQLNEHGAKAVGMGGAFVAQANDPSAIYFNPAGLAFQQGTNFYAGGTFVIPTHTYKNSSTGAETSTDNQIFFPPSVYGTYAINSDLVVGIGVFTPYGLGTRWPSGWEGDRSAVNTQIQTLYFNPSIAYKINDQLSVGFGVSYIYGSVDLSKNLSSTSLLSMSGTGHDWGFNCGILYKPLDKLSIGASFRSLTKLKFSGDVSFGSIGVKGNATIPLPASAYLGAAYQVSPDLTIEADLQFVGWSSYYDLTMNFTDIPSAYSSVIPSSSTSIKNWDDSYMGRIGAEYKLNTDWKLRGGLVYDITPQPRSTTEPMMPDADRVDISVGAGYKITENLYVDATYMLALFSEKSAPISTTAISAGTYNSTAHVFSINFGYSL